MIFDSMERIARYAEMPHFWEITKFLASNDMCSMADGEYPILESKVKARVFSYMTRPSTELDFEIHKGHMDVQIILEGVEYMLVANPDQLTQVETPAIPMSGDWTFFSARGDTSSFVVERGSFAVFYPGEAHKPNCMIHRPVSVKKLIFKVKM